MATEPLAIGIAAANRDRTNAMTPAPASTQNHATTPVHPNGASCEGRTKIPDPIIPPTTSAVAVQKPNGRVVAGVVTVRGCGKPLDKATQRGAALNPTSRGSFAARAHAYRMRRRP